ncbi:MAG TPA: class I SAM-dependent methyltransferase family protein, partial [Thermoplasmata archaeon]|nr:class I SAM-dependent methyltransferase family protein [Thermoplasmata archaeon]
ERAPLPQDVARAALPSDIAARAPRRYERIGDVLVLRLPPDVPGRHAIAEAYAHALGAKTVLHDRGVRGAWREPDMEVLFGGDTETGHIEDGIRFRLDLAKVMFSSGNVDERIRMGRAVGPGETVVDLFAGIGYFALPMAVHGRPAKVIACEVNPTAFRYLEENVRLNRAWAVETRFGDCREVAPRACADRIVMGYLDGEVFLDVAMGAAKDGCILHYHESTPIEEVPDGPWSRVESAARAAGFHADRLAVRRIKSYAPRIAHVVVDARLTR